MVVVGNDSRGLLFHLVHRIGRSISPVGDAEERQVVEVVAESHYLPGVERVDDLLCGGRLGDSLRVDFEVAVAGVDNVAVAEQAAFAGAGYLGRSGFESVEQVDDQDKEGRAVE